MKLAIVGSRGFNDPNYFNSAYYITDNIPPKAILEEINVRNIL